MPGFLYNRRMKKSLRDIIADRIVSGGPITFRDFMETALYYPELGYYNRREPKIGKEGDFYTAADVSAVFGEALAEEARRRLAEMGEGPFTLIEPGAGTGRLAADIINYLEAIPDLDHWRYAIVERSPELIKTQQRTLKPYLERVYWTTLEALADAPVRGIIIQNEVIDAFAVHKVKMTEDGVREVFVGFKGGEFVELLEAPSIPELERYPADYGKPLEVGQCAEINLAALDWLEALSKAIARGFIVTVDYGGLAGDVYHPMRFDGTLVCYHNHELKDDPYQDIGERDMTAHVNFTALIVRGSELGLEKVSIESQANFLISRGVLERVEEQQKTAGSAAEKMKLRLAVKNLIMPDAMGERFQVLIQEKKRK